jgi:hypothetical protein
MSDRPLWDITTTGADEKVAAGAAARIVRRMIMVLLLTAAALDLTRYGLVMTAARHPAPTAGLVAAGLAAATFTARTARGCQAGQRWAGWTALLIGAASTPQAAASGFRSPYTIPDIGTAVLCSETISASDVPAPAGSRRNDCLRKTAAASLSEPPRAGCIFTVLTCITLLFSGGLATTTRPI